MAKKNNKHSKRVRNLVSICFLCAVVLSVSTYAWFIGMKTVNVSSFEVEIATTEGLYLSMDGTASSWTYTLDARNTEAYENNTNVWAENGLIPVSTIGEVDSTSATMKLFDKGSLTASAGGYRLLTGRIDNYTTKNAGNFYTEGDGYVAFDLFIKNLSGEEYYDDNNPLNEEAIYLTTNSAVTVAEGGVDGTGIENSVRVAFIQLGRVKADTTTASTITGITCADVDGATADDDKVVTGICREAAIWEPNDTDHVDNAINWYKTSCTKRTGATVSDDASYATDTDCTTVTDGAANKTYAISRVIDIADQVDVYDGLNLYTANSQMTSATYFDEDTTDEERAAAKLVDYDYFTDTEKNETGNDRDQFMTLAPNSITKVRVYIYLEGQDVDNYDFAQLGKKISVNFGFTKERYTEDDVNYEGPSTDITDTASAGA